MTSVSATPAALALLGEIVAEHGPVLFHQSGGCCDGSSPMCYPANEFRVGEGYYVPNEALANAYP